MEVGELILTCQMDNKTATRLMVYYFCSQGRETFFSSLQFGILEILKLFFFLH